MLRLTSKNKVSKEDSGLSTLLAFASFAVGLTELLATEKVEKLLGVSNSKGTTGVIRALGVREVMHGVDILTHDDPTPGIRARVAGDMLDGALLMAAGMKTKNMTGFLTACALVAPIVILDHVMAARLE